MPGEFYNDQLSRLAKELQILPDKPEETAEATLKSLWHTAFGEPKSAIMAETSNLPDLNENQLQVLQELIEQRLSGIPLAHLSRRQNFMGIEMLSGPEALIPRKETELLGYRAVELVKTILENRENALIIDICTGAGNLPVALAINEKKAKIYASDLSADAVSLARKNVELHGLAKQVELRIGDLLSPFECEEFCGNVDLLTCNPPYISSAKVKEMPGEISNYEPASAFDGGPFGIRLLNKLLQEAPKYLKRGGWIAFEVGAGQGPAMIRRMQSINIANYQDIQVVADDNGEIRVISAHL